MAEIKDVARYFIKKGKDGHIVITHLKLQKLVYYAQALYLVIYRQPLFSNKIEAWVHGPVCPDLYRNYKYNSWDSLIFNEKYDNSEFDGLGEAEKDVLDKIFVAYGRLSGGQLEILTHNDEPWKTARVGLKPWENSNREISTKSIFEFYTKKYRATK